VNVVKISVRKLHKSYKDASRELTIVNNLSFDFPASGCVAIVGRSGTGKSTLMHLLGGLDRAGSGEILYDGSDICALKGDKLSDFRGRNIGFIFQFHHLLPEFDALENVAMPLIVAGRSQAEAQSAAEKMLMQVGLEKRMRHRPGQLSGGEQQRVAIARAIVNEPPVVLADEPTGNLDFETGREVQEILMRMNRQQGNLMIVVTHNQDLARSMDMVLEMSPGGNLELIS
jgi:lipoprotein-releasing system ATP-binding protein